VRGGGCGGGDGGEQEEEGERRHCWSGVLGVGEVVDFSGVESWSVGVWSGVE
jgi:hypothetical protein